MTQPIRILLQTTIEHTDNDWHIGRFSLLREYLESLRADDGEPLCRVIARDRDPIGAPDSVLAALDRSQFDELWLFAVDTGNGLHEQDHAGILRFHAQGGGLMVTRDHMDLGCSICTLGAVGAAHVFHTHNMPGEVPAPDDRDTPAILWPNFHSGANGDAQRIRAELPLHPVMLDPASDTGVIEYLPSHPHEGAVVAPQTDSAARVIVTGTSRVTGQRFNIAVAFEPTPHTGPAIAQSTFHHFADYNWDARRGSPDFVTEPPSCVLPGNARAMNSIHRYVRNLAQWLAGRN